VVAGIAGYCWRGGGILFFLLASSGESGYSFGGVGWLIYGFLVRNGMNKTVLSILSHPDDAEFMCTGTLALLAGAGWDVHIATLSAGDCGSNKLGREEIADIRRAEGAEAAGVIGGTYHCLECEDAFIMYDKPTLQKVISLVRRVKPGVVFAASPVDYFVDHENTSRLARTACFTCGVPNVECDCMEAYDFVPYLYYVDAMEGKGIYGEPIVPSIYVDISAKIDVKEKMLCCHASQRDWLLEHHHIDEYVIAMKGMSKGRGDEVGCGYAEGFRQHLGHAYPGDNVLKEILGDLVK